MANRLYRNCLFFWEIAYFLMRKDMILYNQESIASQVVNIVSVIGGNSEASSDAEAEANDLMAFELDYER